MASFNTQNGGCTTNTWLTPRWLLDLLGGFDTDPCAAEGRPWDCARVNYTEAENGLLQRWEGRVWCNPPYGREAAAFMRRMAEHRRGLALVFVRSETQWFQDCVLGTARYLFFLRGRVRFCRLDGRPGNVPNAPSCLVAWDDAEEILLRDLEQEGYGKLVYV